MLNHSIRLGSTELGEDQIKTKNHKQKPHRNIFSSSPQLTKGINNPIFQLKRKKPKSTVAPPQHQPTSLADPAHMACPRPGVRWAAGQHRVSRMAGEWGGLAPSRPMRHPLGPPIFVAWSTCDWRPSNGPRQWFTGLSSAAVRAEHALLHLSNTTA